jgi:hypothetical protein
MVEDKDDVNLEADIDNLLSKEGCKVDRFDKPVTMRLRPQPWSVGSDNNRTKILGGWCPCTQPGTFCYGLKMKPVKESTFPGYTYSFTYVCKIAVEGKHAN